MREVRLPKVDRKGNHIPEDSTPTREELRRDLENGTRIIQVEQTEWNEFLVGGQPNGDIDGDAFRAVLAEAAETNIAAQVALEHWDARGNTKAHTARLTDEDGCVDLEGFKVAFDKGFAAAPRQSRRMKLDTYKVTLALNLLAGLGSAALGEDFEWKARRVLSYAFGEIEWDEITDDRDQGPLGDGWKKSRVVRSGNQTRH